MIKFIAIVVGYLLIGSLLPFLKRRENREETEPETSSMKTFTSDETGPDRASVIIESADALNVRIEAVRSAKSSIDVLTFKIIDSESTRAFFGECWEAAERGVSVNIMVNGVTSLFYNNKPYMQALGAHPNITFRLYNPVKLWKPWRLQFMMHDKIILVDETYLLIGGRNIDERHFRPNGYKWPMAYDLELFVVRTEENTEAPSVLYEVKDYIQKFYDYELTEVVKGKENPKLIQRILETKEKYPSTNPQFYEKSMEDFIAQTVSTNKITLIHNPIEVGIKEPALGRQLKALFEHAKDGIIMQTPYMTYDKNILKTMDAIADKIELTVLTNSTASTPNFFAFSNYYGHRRKFIDTGASIYEFQSTDSVHNKSFIMDDSLSIIGTFNMDARSLYINTEAVLVVDGEAFTEYFMKDVQKFKGQSLKLGNDNTYESSDSVEELPVSMVKRVFLLLHYILFRPIQFLL